MIFNPTNKLTSALIRTEHHLEAFKQVIESPKKQVSEKLLTQLVKNLVKDDQKITSEFRGNLHHNHKMNEQLQKNILKTLGFLLTDQNARTKVNQVGALQQALWSILANLKKDISKNLDNIIKLEKGENVEKVEMWTQKYFQQETVQEINMNTLEITSPVFKNGQLIPVRHSCQGEDLSPQLLIKDLPNGTKTLAVIMEDPDAPSGTFTHWLAWNIPANLKELAEGYKAPNEGTNSFNKQGYNGPCPPHGSKHRYFFKVFALNTNLNLPNGTKKEELLKALHSSAIGYGELMGLFER